MAWPKFMQRLFANSGAGPLLREDIIPDTAKGNYLPLSGGTVTGNLTVNGTLTGNLTGNADTATALKTSRTVRTNLASTSTASFNGTANITPGVTGILPIANGGTGASTAAGALDALGIIDAIESAASGISGAVVMSQLYAHSALSITDTKVLSDSVDIVAPGQASRLLINGTVGGLGAKARTLSVAVNGVTIGTKTLSDLWLEYKGGIASGDTVTVTLTITEYDDSTNSSVYYNGAVFFLA